MRTLRKRRERPAAQAIKHLPMIFRASGPAAERSSALNDGREAAVHHAGAVKGHFEISHAFVHPRIFHDLGVYAVAMRAGFVGDPREDDGFSLLRLNAFRERHAHFYGEIFADALAVLEGTVIEPDFARDLRDLGVSGQVFGGNREDETVDVVWHGIFYLFGFNCVAPTDDGSAGSLKDPTNEMTPFGRIFILCELRFCGLKGGINYKDVAGCAAASIWR
jgi:hypothetical protein